MVRYDLLPHIIFSITFQKYSRQIVYTLCIHTYWLVLNFKSLKKSVTNQDPSGPANANGLKAEKWKTHSRVCRCYQLVTHNELVGTVVKLSWAIICKVGNFSALLQRAFLFTSLFPAIAIVMVPIKMFWQWYCQTGIRAPEIATHFLILPHFYSWAADFAFRVHSGKPKSHYFYEIFMQGLEIGHFCCDGQPLRRHYLNPSIWFYNPHANLFDLW